MLSNADIQTTQVSKPKDTVDSRTEILQTAAEVFTEYGYAATSIDSIAESGLDQKARLLPLRQ